MSLRLTLFLSFFFLALIIPLAFPYAGLLIFSWLSYMRPQNYIWGSENFRFSYYVAIVTLIGCFLQKEKFYMYARENAIMIWLFIVFIISTAFALYPTISMPKLMEMSKIFLIAILTSSLLNSKKRFRITAWTIALCLGFIAIKGALRGVFFGWRLSGPADSMIADNNDLALALNMTLPFFFYLGITESKKILKWLSYLCFPFMIIAIIYTFSRGGFVGLCAVSFLMAVKAKRKILGLILLAVGIALFIKFAPAEHKERMETIATYQEDTSAMGRIYAWQAAWHMALDRPFTGVGIGNKNFLLAFPRYHWFEPRVAHNSYFQILANAGFIALGLFLLLLYFSISKLRAVRRSCAKNSKLSWIVNYSNMLEVSLIGYMVSGFFLSRADFDLLYQFIGMVVALNIIAHNTLQNA